MLGLGVFTVRALWSLRSNKALVAPARRVRHAPPRRTRAERRKEVDALSRGRRTEAAPAELALVDGFAEDVDVAQIDREPRKMLWSGRDRGARSSP